MKTPSEVLLSTCLAFPTLARRPRVAPTDDLPAAKRQDVEALAAQLAEENLRHVRLPVDDEERLFAELQSSVAGLKRQLFAGTCRTQAALIFLDRARQVAEPGEEPDATLLDALSVRVLATHQRVLERREEELALLEEAGKLVAANQAHLEHIRLQRQEEDEEVSERRRQLCRERSALRTVFTALILQSQADWSKDQTLRAVVYPAS
jgi:hypothetical protein